MDKVSMSIVYFFNKSLHEDLFDGGEFSDLYEMVEDNSWTFENMRKMVIAAATENGDGQWDEKDVYALKDFMDYNNYGGAVLLGANKTVVKGHGSSKAVSVFHCIEQAYNMEKKNLREAISQAVAQTE